MPGRPNSASGASAPGTIQAMRSFAGSACAVAMVASATAAAKSVFASFILVPPEIVIAESIAGARRAHHHALPHSKRRAQRWLNLEMKAVLQAEVFAG